MVAGGQLPGSRGRGAVDLGRQCPFGGRRDHQMSLDPARFGQQFEYAQADRRAGGAADPDDDAEAHRAVPAGCRPSDGHSVSMRAMTSGVMAMGRPHSRSVSGGSLLVASMPSLPPSPGFGEAKSR